MVKILFLASTVFLGWGVLSAQGVCTTNPIACENALTGNLQSEWDVSGIGDPSIQGFATDISVNRGQTISFKVNTNATAYRIDIYRLGYYGGRGARKVATVNPSVSLPQSQPAYLRDATTGLVDCGNWAVSASWAVPSTATSGVYIARLVRTDTGGASHIIFIVRDDTGQSDMLFQTSDTTWHAYNNYGGANLYRGNGPGLYGRNSKVSYNRPFNNRNPNSFGEQEGFLFNSEYPMIRWLEANGYDVSYASDVDTDRRGSAALTQHKIFLSVGHDEYWSGQQRTNVEAARAAGIHLGFFSANEIYWKTRWENSIAGPSTAYRTLVCYKETNVDARIDPTGVWTGTWRDPRFTPPADGGRPENALSGQVYAVDAFRNDPMTVSATEGKLRLWRNTGIDTLAVGESAQFPAGVLGFEWDETPDNGFQPPGLVRMSTTTIPVDKYLVDYGTLVAPATATHHLSLYRHSSGALVFGAGTTQWSWGLDSTHDFAGPAPDGRMKQATVNLFADMGAQPMTLQSGLSSATQSTDVIAPTSAISTPPGSTVLTCTPATISGTATDAGGGKPAAVEYSLDGGTRWHPANGAANWSATWTPAAPGTATIKIRAVDDSGRIESAGPSVTVTVVENPSGCSLRPPSGTLYRAINLGGPPMLTDGQYWEANTTSATPNFTTNSFAGSAPNAFFNPPVDTPDHATMLRTFRDSANLQFSLTSVPNATYNVYIWVFEDGPSSLNATLSVNGSVVLPSYNTGPTGHWDRLGPYPVTVSDGTIQVGYVCNTPGDAGLLSGVEVWQLRPPIANA
ncbi:MAG: N,N-dimethylformamidase beta subunit family domain-containing protein, partial [Nitrospirota bacterium]